MINKDRSVTLYQSISEEDKPRVFKHWHASSISQCPRAHYFTRLGISRLPHNRPSAARLLRWGAGHHLEKEIRPHVEKVYGEIKSNERITSKKLDLTGEFDNLVIAGSRLVEIKSVSDFAFIQRDNEISLKEATGNKNKWGKDEYRPKTTPYLGHELQNHAYALLLEETGIKVEQIDYVYLSLNGRIVVYQTEVQPELTTNVKNRLRALQEAWKTKTPPLCICDPGHPLYDSVMTWCDYRNDPDCCSLKLLNKKEV